MILLPPDVRTEPVLLTLNPVEADNVSVPLATASDGVPEAYVNPTVPEAVLTFPLIMPVEVRLLNTCPLPSANVLESPDTSKVAPPFTAMLAEFAIEPVPVNCIVPLLMTVLPV